MGQSFKDLIVWQRSIELTTGVYKLTSKFPDSERFGLTNQMRRASVSIASNIAEGYGRAQRRASTFSLSGMRAVPVQSLKHKL